MALDALLAKLEGRVVTSVTADVTPDVTPKPAPMLACTPVTSVTPVTAENDDTAGKATSEPLSDPAAEARRNRVLSMLAEHPEARYAALTDMQADPQAVLLTLAIRDQATCELRIPREKWDGVLFLELLERHSATIH